MKKLFRRILLWMAFSFRWKSKKFSDLFFEEMHERTNDIVDKIDLDTSEIKILNKR